MARHEELCRLFMFQHSCDHREETERPLHISKYYIHLAPGVAFLVISLRGKRERSMHPPLLFLCDFSIGTLGFNLEERCFEGTNRLSRDSPLPPQLTTTPPKKKRRNPNIQTSLLFISFFYVALSTQDEGRNKTRKLERRRK